MKLPFKSIAIICGFTATVFCFFHPIVATAITAVFLVHRRVMRKGREVPKMLPMPLAPYTMSDDDWDRSWRDMEENFRDFSRRQEEMDKNDPFNLLG